MHPARAHLHQAGPGAVHPHRPSPGGVRPRAPPAPRRCAPIRFCACQAHHRLGAPPLRGRSPHGLRRALGRASRGRVHRPGVQRAPQGRPRGRGEGAAPQDPVRDCARSLHPPPPRARAGHRLQHRPGLEDLSRRLHPRQGPRGRVGPRLRGRDGLRARGSEHGGVCLGHEVKGAGRRNGAIHRARAEHAHRARHRVGGRHAPRPGREPRRAAPMCRGHQRLPHHAPGHGLPALRPAPGQSAPHARRAPVHPRLGHDAARARGLAVLPHRVHRPRERRGPGRHPPGLRQPRLHAPGQARPGVEVGHDGGRCVCASAAELGWRSQENGRARAGGDEGPVRRRPQHGSAPRQGPRGDAGEDADATPRRRCGCAGRDQLRGGDEPPQQGALPRAALHPLRLARLLHARGHRPEHRRRLLHREAGLPLPQPAPAHRRLAPRARRAPVNDLRLRGRPAPRRLRRGHRRTRQGG
mmetsp:Transcript_18897/g.59915  ORF Transcript_18897/g.59915 Transcript_18897/m.59915 type:complete len:468 (+) Transcript_18897:558-1961(+)